MKIYSKDNIIAIASPTGTGAISILRASGETVIAEINKIFLGKDLTKMAKNTFTFGKIVDNDEVIDSVVVLIYHKPNSYTGEDSVEITTHGGVLVTEKVLHTIINNTNIKLASKGEFSKRAYLNQKLDLIQAESIMALINSESKASLKVASMALEKKTTRKIKTILEDILNILSKIEVDIDYPEYEKEDLTDELLIKELTKIKKQLETLHQESGKTKLLVSGVNVAIVGKPNVGKSSLLNKLLKKKRAITSSIEGTTRDLISESILLNGIKINLLDTAGIRSSGNEIEKQGIEISKKTIKKADLVIVVLDANNFLKEEDLKILNLTKNKKRIICINKTDLNNSVELTGYNNVLKISTLKNKGILNLEKEIINCLKLNNLSNSDFCNLFSKRQIDKVFKVIKLINEAIKEIKQETSTIIVASLIKNVYNTLLELVGEKYDGDLEKQIFKNFCLGK